MSYLHDYIKLKEKEFRAICKRHKVNKLYAFGSSITEDFHPNHSDIDFLVSIEVENPLERGELLMALWDKLEVFFQRKVDLITENSIRNPYLKMSIENTKILMYDSRGEKISV